MTDPNPIPILHEIEISPSAGKIHSLPRELWDFRDLCLYLAKRSIAVRYKQTVLGFAWAIAQPFGQMIVFSVIIGGLVKVPSHGMPYPIFVYAGLLPWQMFSRMVAEMGGCLVSNRSIITKIYFPRICLPVSIAYSAFFDFCIASSILIVLMLYYGIYPGLEIIALPVFLLLLVVSAIGIGAIFSVFHVKYRDVSHGVPLLLQMWMFCTPVIYPPDIIPTAWTYVYALNPMLIVIEGMRFCFIGGPPPTLVTGLISASIGLTLFVVGIILFERKQASIADLLGR